jgi:hypothetical protein
MAKERELAIFTAVYDRVDSANADLDAVEALHQDDFLGTFDAAGITEPDRRMVGRRTQ